MAVLFARSRSTRRRTARVAALVGAAVLTIFVSACNAPAAQDSAGATGPRTATLADPNPQPVTDHATPVLPADTADAEGTPVTVADTSRIVAMDRYGTLTQTVYALGLGDSLVGRDIAAKFPAVEDVPVVNPGGQSINAEAILDLRPTVVLTDTSIGPRGVQDQLRAAGVPVVFFDPHRSLDTVDDQILAVARALGVGELGDRLAARTSDEIAAARTRAPEGQEPLEIAFLYTRGPAITMIGGPGSGADSLIDALGAVDAGTKSGITQEFVAITSEALIAAAPDDILMMTHGLESIGGIDGLEAIPGIAQTPAGRSKSVVDMDDGVLLGFGPNTGRVLAALADAFYPDTAS
ncbi:ABC transporter substrate-binding protein [Rhodococcus sp. HNM0569]|uniref:heme/hemin ABC transporter substrate-binding protein n=1 Tax=Rhodococcus sp. HNM0569 TaxID=2716340 RepID=UPI00146C2091|nr:ABC transporter substrate-binding protein [Rhodococcus sp. HNM0569]NLU84963.1 ABC transporter substrate-binding protein [Rhodococcus sp. HNM0569]